MRHEFSSTTSPTLGCWRVRVSPWTFVHPYSGYVPMLLKNFPCALAKSAFHGRLRRSSTRVFVCHRLRSAKTRCRRCPSSRRLALRPRRTGALSPRVSSGVFSLLAEVSFHLGDPISLRAGGVPSAARVLPSASSTLTGSPELHLHRRFCLCKRPWPPPGGRGGWQWRSLRPLVLHLFLRGAVLRPPCHSCAMSLGQFVGVILSRCGTA